MAVGIEGISPYLGHAFVSLSDLFAARGLDQSRLANLMMVEKSVSLPCEDAVTNAVNAAEPLIGSLSDRERNNIKLLIVATESGIDFGKSVSTYVHHYLKLKRECRLFEVKQACYAGTAAVQMAASTIRASQDSEAKALVIASDDARPASRMTFAEPSQGTGAVAMIIGRDPHVLAIDHDASGYCSFEVMDTCRPTEEMEVGDADLSIMSYLHCLTESYASYCGKVSGVDLERTFQFLSFHTPFAGMVKGAHRKLLRAYSSRARQNIDKDFAERVEPSVQYAMRVGNIYSGSIFLALCSLLDNADIMTASRVGCFSYGSGCSSEFFSGTITGESARRVGLMQIEKQLNGRARLSMEAYDRLLDLKKRVTFGTETWSPEESEIGHDRFRDAVGRQLLKLSAINGYHRMYEWS